MATERGASGATMAVGLARLPFPSLTSWRELIDNVEGILPSASKQDLLDYLWKRCETYPGGLMTLPFGSTRRA